jgi:hypothetical protein
VFNEPPFNLQIATKKNIGTVIKNPFIKDNSHMMEHLEADSEASPIFGSENKLMVEKQASINSEPLKPFEFKQPLYHCECCPQFKG